MKKTAVILIALLSVLSCTKNGLLDGGESFDSMASGSPGGSGQDSTMEPGQITAGEWNDLENWFLWDTLIHGETYGKMAEYWDMSTDGSIRVRLENTMSELLTDVKVELIEGTQDVVWTSRTDNLGKATCWYKPFANARNFNYDNLSIRINNRTYPLNESFTEGVITISNIELQNPNLPTADICFMVDATGSMSDELEYLKVELMDVIEQVQSSFPEMSIRTGSVFYRDEGDQYVTRESDFTLQTKTTISFIKDQKADGGGDFPEAVHTALDKSINQLSWSSEARARLLFMVLDAPPHHEDQIIGSIQNRIEDAAEMGIKMIPVVASGIDKETEFLMRYMAIFTNGTYVFITNDSGIGNEHLIPTVGQYEVEMLNDLMVRLISENLSQ